MPISFLPFFFLFYNIYPNSMIRVVIADPHQIYPETLARMLNARTGISVTSFCSVNSVLPGIIRQLQPDVLLLDPAVKNHGEEAIIKKIRAIAHCKIICLSMHCHPAYAKKMFAYGVDGFIVKDAPIEEFVQAIDEVLAGNHYTCKETTNLLTASGIDPMLSGDTEAPLAVQPAPVATKEKKGAGWLLRFLRAVPRLKPAGT